MSTALPSALPPTARAAQFRTTRATAPLEHTPPKIPISPQPQDDFFAPQPTPTELLPDPRMLVENIARSIVEILAGARDLDQIGRWVTDDVYRHTLKRVVLAGRARRMRSEPEIRPTVVIRTTRLSRPASGVVEGVVVVELARRTRVVALRLEGLDRRWRVTDLHVL